MQTFFFDQKAANQQLLTKRVSDVMLWVSTCYQATRLFIYYHIFVPVACHLVGLLCYFKPACLLCCTECLPTKTRDSVIFCSPFTRFSLKDDLNRFKKPVGFNWRLTSNHIRLLLPLYKTRCHNFMVNQLKGFYNFNLLYEEEVM